MLPVKPARELAARKSRVSELQVGIEEQRRIVDNTTSTFRRQQMDSLDKLQQRVHRFRDGEAKAAVHQGLMKIIAMVNGTVQQLNAHTVGGVVTTTQPLMEIVPDDTQAVE